MRILISNSTNTHLLAPQYVKEFQSLGFEIESTYYMDVTLKHSKVKIGRAILNLTPFFPYFFSNLIFLLDIWIKKPDVIVIFKGMEIFPTVLKFLNKRKFFLVNYNLDHPFNYISKASGNKNVLNSLEYYNLHLTYSKQIQKELNDNYKNIIVEYLPFGFHSYVKKMKFSYDPINCICFIGQADSERAKTISFLLENDFEIHLYGNGWQKYFQKGENIKVFPPVTGKEYWQTLNKYNIQLNLLRPHNYDSHNMRTFEIPAAGSIMVSNRTTEQLKFYKENKEAFYFESNDELLDKVKYILTLSQYKINSIREDAKKASLGHSYHDRALEFYNIIRTHYESFYTNFSALNNT